MVLIKHLLVSVLLINVLFIAGCETTSPKKRVIPAYTDPEPDETDASASSGSGGADSVPEDDTDASVLTPKNNYEPNIRFPSSSIVESLLARAEKAMSLKQGLRAQHLLEQAVHIAPGDARIFLVYGDVYLKLGILEQAEQMYRRAISLAGEESALGFSARQKLSTLKAGN